MLEYKCRWCGMMNYDEIHVRDQHCQACDEYSDLFAVPQRVFAPTPTELLQGYVAGLLTLNRGGDDMPLKVERVDVPQDADGNYADYIEVTLSSGKRIHILMAIFEPELFEPELPPF